MNTSTPTHLQPVAQLGDQQIDQDHAEMQTLMLVLRDAPDAELVHALDELHDHTVQHFRLEDDELRRLKGSNATCHLDEHAAVLKSMSEVKGLLAEQRPEVSPDRAKQVARSLARELLGWFPEHVEAMDAGLAGVRAKERLGGAPIKLMKR
jgi:hemerythrin